VLRGFDPPASPYGSGHRGIDIAAPAGTVVVAPAPGVVSFAGNVAGQLYLSIDHGAGLVSTSSYLSAILVAADDPVIAGQAVAVSGAGHPGLLPDHLHFGVRLAGAYVDPLDYLEAAGVVDLIRLAPIATGSGDGRPQGPGPRSGIGPGPSPAAAGRPPGWAPPSVLRGRPVPA
jgi:murein DD-endopeptidase MepM/ murein hydrolase activator NlpD